MTAVISTLANAITYLNGLYEQDSTDPTSGDESYALWTALFNIAIGIWENEEGMLWRELYVSLADATDGDKTISASTWDYDCPTDFRFVVGKVRLVSPSGVSSYYEVIPPTDVSLYDDNSGRWCYFTGNVNTGYDLHFNPDLNLTTGDTIAYEYYKNASTLSSPTDKFEMADPMFAVFYALSELKKDEGDTSALSIASQKLESMKTKNIMPAHWQESSLMNKTDDGFGY
jgi:hypothetical protein